MAGEDIIWMRIRCNYCGATHRVPLWYLKLRSIFSNRYSFVCQDCHRYNVELLRFHVCHDSTNAEEKMYNKNVKSYV